MGTRAIMQHPSAAPNFRCLPYLVRGMPSALDRRPLAADRPTARLHENDRPGMPKLAHVPVPSKL